MNVNIRVSNVNFGQCLIFVYLGLRSILMLCEQDNRFLKTALLLISTGKSFSLSGPSGAGKSTLIHYVLSRLDVNCYKPSLVHYGGLQRNGILKAIADVLGVDTNGRTVPILINLQKQIMKI